MEHLRRVTRNAHCCSVGMLIKCLLVLLFHRMIIINGSNTCLKLDAVALYFYDSMEAVALYFKTR